jgi:hypothetical protein
VGQVAIQPIEHFADDLVALLRNDVVSAWKDHVPLLRGRRSKAREGQTTPMPRAPSGGSTR